MTIPWAMLLHIVRTLVQEQHQQQPALNGAVDGVGVAIDDFQITFVALPPTITSFTPTSGGVDAVVTIIGTNFTGATAVTIGGQPARSFVVVDTTTITAVVGDNFITSLVTVTQGATATSSALVPQNFTRLACVNTLGVPTITPVSDIGNGFGGFDLAFTNGGTYDYLVVGSSIKY